MSQLNKSNVEEAPESPLDANTRPREFSIEKDTMNFVKFILKNDTTIINIVAIIGTLLAIWGFVEGYKATGVDYNVFNSAYSTLRLFTFEIDAPDLQGELVWQLELSRWLIVLFMFYYVAKGIMLIVRTEAKLWWLGFTNGGHVIICGAGEKGKTLGLDWIKEKPGTRLVYIEPDESNPNIETLEEAGAVVIRGKAQEESILTKALIEKASHIVMTTDFDTTNMEIISTIMCMDSVRQRGKKLECYVHLLHNEFYDFFLAEQFTHKKNEVTRIEVKIFNIYANAARMLFRNKTLGSNLFKTVKDIKNRDLSYKVAVLGFGKMGESVLIQLLQLGHFYNQNPIDITIVYDKDRDINANIEDEFSKQYNILNDRYNGIYWNVKFIDDGDFFNEEPHYHLIVVAYENEFESLSNLMKMIKRFNHNLIDQETDVALYSRSFPNIASIINAEKDVFKQTRTFGEINATCNYSIVIDEKLDEKAVLNNKQYNELHGFQLNEWKHLDMFSKDSNRYLIEHNTIKKYFINKFIDSREVPGDYESLKKSIESKYFAYPGMKINWDAMDVQNTGYDTKLSEDEIVTLAKVEHMRWNAFHILNGWQGLSIPADATTKIQKDRIRKEHPCITSWEGLDCVSENHQHDYKSDDIETIMRIPSLDKLLQDKQQRK